MALDEPLTKSTINTLCKDVFENLQNTGVFDDIRIQLYELVCEKNECFVDVVEYFKKGINDFCRTANFDNQRTVLRNQLSAHMEGPLRYRSILRELVSQLMHDQKEYVRSKYYLHGGQYLKNKFAPKIPDPPEEERSQEVEIKDEKKVGDDDRVNNIKVESKEIQVDNNEHLEQVKEDKIFKHEEDEQQQLDTLEVVDMDLESCSSTPSAPVPSPFTPERELEELTMSSVSSIKTADLSDFDYSIKLSDDEASIVGFTKDVKVRIDEVNSKIAELQTIMPPVNDESKGVEKRTRKSNPKYDNEDFLID